jgi:hypothetical protein
MDVDDFKVGPSCWNTWPTPPPSTGEIDIEGFRCIPDIFSASSITCSHWRTSYGIDLPECMCKWHSLTHSIPPVGKRPQGKENVSQTFLDFELKPEPPAAMPAHPRHHASDASCVEWSEIDIRPDCSIEIGPVVIEPLRRPSCRAVPTRARAPRKHGRPQQPQQLIIVGYALKRALAQVYICVCVCVCVCVLYICVNERV